MDEKGNKMGEGSDHQIYNNSLMIASRLLLLLALVLLAAAAPRECSQSSCFVKQLFDFNYPREDTYNITTGSSPTQMDSFLKAYGDFNNDLRADYVSVDGLGNTLIFIYSTSSGNYELSPNSVAVYQSCQPVNYYLYDANDDGSLDITVWGTNPTGNCMYLLLQNEGIFQPAISTQNFTATTQPILFQFNLPASGSTIETNCLLLFNAGANLRQIYYYNNGAYSITLWTDLFTGQDYSSVPFSSQHWNTFIDITNDCFPDFILTNTNGQNAIQFWIYNSQINKYAYNSTQVRPNPIVSLNIIDVNYDGSLDFIIAEINQIFIYFGLDTLNIDSTFCVAGSTNFNINWAAPSILAMEAGNTLPQQNLQFADINVNGYPQLMALATSSGSTHVLIYENQFQNGGTFSTFSSYQDAVAQKIASQPNLSILTASFFDILDNGIVDLFFNVQINGAIMTRALYNNYLYQNFFYIKGYGTNGKTTSKGAQVAGVSFYWANSVGNTQRVSYCSQISQTAYTAYPMPYVLTGLGRANNYVEMFTVGRLGESESWSPIIPNSQLALFTGSSPSSGWGIKIFIMPADSLVYVVIVCIVILALLGLTLVLIKCRKKKPQVQPLLADI